MNHLISALPFEAFVRSDRGPSELKYLALASIFSQNVYLAGIGIFLVAKLLFVPQKDPSLHVQFHSVEQTRIEYTHNHLPDDHPSCFLAHSIADKPWVDHDVRLPATWIVFEFLCLCVSLHVVEVLSQKYPETVDGVLHMCDTPAIAHVIQGAVS
jgi:hypothetical protein